MIVTITVKNDGTHWVEVNFIGKAGEKVLFLGKVITNGNHRFTTAFKIANGCTDGLQLTNATTG